MVNSEIKKCFFCGNSPKYAKQNGSNHCYEIDCGVCGAYALSFESSEQLEEDGSDEMRQAVAWVIKDRPAITEPITRPVLRDLVRQGLEREPSPSGKSRLLLLRLGTKSREFGRPVLFNEALEWPTIKCRGAAECFALIGSLRERNLIAPPRSQSQVGLALTWKAWELLEPVRGSVAKTVFVAMAFQSEMDDVYNIGIEPAIERTGLTPIRLDRETFSEKVCERILTEIHSAAFVIADFTHQRGGVYFEAGYALALGKQIVWLCRDDHVSGLHFDTRQYPHIVWSTPSDLAPILEARLRYLVVRGENSPGI